MVLIGSGLTMVDVLLSARRDGFQGNAVVISRRGQLPRTHAPKGVVPQQVAFPHSKRVSLLAASIRIACEMAESGGTSWQAIINGLRPSIQNIWQGLPHKEQARFLRHLRPFWDAHRHRPSHGGAWPPQGGIRRRPRYVAPRRGERSLARGRQI